MSPRRTSCRRCRPRSTSLTKQLQSAPATMTRDEERARSCANDRHEAEAAAARWRRCDSSFQWCRYARGSRRSCEEAGTGRASSMCRTMATRCCWITPVSRADCRCSGPARERISRRLLSMPITPLRELRHQFLPHLRQHRPHPSDCNDRAASDRAEAVASDCRRGSAASLTAEDVINLPAE